MRIENVKIYGIDETAKASGYPMQASLDEYEERAEIGRRRLQRLGKARIGSGHDCALKGIVTQADITAPQYWWLQFGRYHFADIVSSQSKMHRLIKMDVNHQCNRYVEPEIKNKLSALISNYNKIKDLGESDKILFQKIVANCPMGLMLTARITTNYLQLKTMYFQRKNHRLEEWRIFCNWAMKLPMFKEVVKAEKEYKKKVEE